MGCSKDIIQTEDNDKIVVLLKSYLNPLSSSKSNPTLTDGSAVGMFIDEVFKYDSNGSAFLNKLTENKLYRNIDNTISGAPVVFYKDKYYRIIGYSPYTNQYESSSGLVKFEHDTDVLWAKSLFPLVNGTNHLNEMPLSFKHLTSQVKFIINDLRDITSKEHFPINNINLKISGFCKYFYMAVVDGEISPGDTDNNVVISQADRFVCITPSYPSDSTKLEVSLIINGISESDNSEQKFNKTFYYTFLENHSYLLTINIRTNSININGQINEWVSKPVDELIIKE
ncbi:MAG: hypothetical protein A2X19_00045 [Bacteroidetes bacterium GWE2_39_28]|nr:MAG: hypothetical protein A2X19_00045 [Bacteroidetes bacterium GWE2_39_28]OFY14382.1 MAG: hypothetical protein A2X16_05375 [Bacteroidetes bacterium GWF2_39_10]